MAKRYSGKQNNYDSSATLTESPRKAMPGDMVRVTYIPRLDRRKCIRFAYGMYIPLDDNTVVVGPADYFPRLGVLRGHGEGIRSKKSRGRIPRRDIIDVKVLERRECVLADIERWASG